MAEGIARAGDHVELVFEDQYDGSAPGDVAVFYGLEGRLPQVFRDYQAKGRAVYIDLGYWGRREGGRWTGYHKVAVNARHPTAYYRRPSHPSGRFERFNVPIQLSEPRGRHAPILLCGMGDKAARAEGYAPETWERWAVNEIRRYTDRPIVYRPKPSWKRARPIEGCGYSPKTREIDAELRGAWAVVTHHSNAAVEAVLAGVPVFCWYGVAADMGLRDLSRIESPRRPTLDERAQWAADIAYTQWSVAEMKAGAPWLHLRAEGIL
jgi:hypothetical protein